MTEKLSEIIELKISNWLAIYILFMAFVLGSFLLRLQGVSEHSLSVSLALFAVISMWLSFGLISYVNEYIHHISSKLVHPGHLERRHPYRSKWENEFVDRFLDDSSSTSSISSSSNRASSPIGGYNHIPQNIQSSSIDSSIKCSLHEPLLSVTEIQQQEEDYEEETVEKFHEDDIAEIDGEEGEEVGEEVGEEEEEEQKQQSDVASAFMSRKLSRTTHSRHIIDISPSSSSRSIRRRSSLGVSSASISNLSERANTTGNTNTSNLAKNAKSSSPTTEKSMRRRHSLTMRRRVSFQHQPKGAYERTLTQKRNDLFESVNLSTTLNNSNNSNNITSKNSANTSNNNNSNHQNNSEEKTSYCGGGGSHEKLIPLFKYYHDGSERPMPRKDCCGRQPNRQEALFWGMKHGSEGVYTYLTTTMLMIAVYIGTFVVNFSTPVYMYVEGYWYFLILVWILVLFPVLGHMVEFSILLPKLLLITSIHDMSSSQLTARTTHIMRSRKALRMLMYACAIKDAHKVAMQVRSKGLRGATFSKLSKKEQDALERTCKVKTYPNGAVMVKQGERNDYLHVIISGEAEVLVKEKQVATLVAPQEFGLLSLLNGVTCTATVRCSKKSPLVCYLLDRTTYDQYFAQKSKISMAVAASEASMKHAVAFHEDNSNHGSPERSPERRRKNTTTTTTPPTTTTTSHTNINTKSDTRQHNDGETKGTSESTSDSTSESESSNSSSNSNQTVQIRSLSSVASAVSVAHKLATKKYIKRHARSRKPGEESFADRVRKGGRPKEAIVAYRRGALVDLFVVMDKDMGGTVDESELTHFLTTLFAGGKSLGEAEVRQIELMIAGLDENGDGEVSINEFLHVMEPIVAQMEEDETPYEITHRMWEVLDVDGGGSVTISEFRDVLERVGLVMSYEEVRELFAEFDDDGSGALEEEELLSFIKSQI